jgi:hypothetical protein
VSPRTFSLGSSLRLSVVKCTLAGSARVFDRPGATDDVACGKVRE